MRKRELILLLLLTAVTCVTVWRVLDPPAGFAVDPATLITQDAPIFQLLDQNNRPAGIRGYLGRHRILVAFFNGAGGPDGDSVMLRLREVAAALKANGVRVLAISTPLAPNVKAQCLSYPFPVLRDTIAGQPQSTCVQWGVCEETTDPQRPPQLRPALFLIDRRGLVNSDGIRPRAVDNPLLTINSLL